MIFQNVKFLFTAQTNTCITLMTVKPKVDVKVFIQQYQISLHYVISIIKSFVNYKKLYIKFHCDKQNSAFQLQLERSPRKSHNHRTQQEVP